MVKSTAFKKPDFAQATTVFAARVLPDAVVGTGYQFLPFDTNHESFFDPLDRFDATINQWVPGNDYGNSIYEITTSLRRMEAALSGVFTMHRANSATMKPLPTETGQNFAYSFTGYRGPGFGTDYGGIYLLNSSGAPVTLSGQAFDRGYWVLTIKQIENSRCIEDG